MAYKAAEMLNIIAKALDHAGFCHKNGLGPSITKTCNSCSCSRILSFNSKGFSHLNAVEDFFMQTGSNDAGCCCTLFLLNHTIKIEKGIKGIEEGISK